MKFFNYILFVLILAYNCEYINCINNNVLNCNLDQDIINDIASYSERVNKIINFFTQGDFKGKTYQSLSDFIDEFGNRIAGSENLENAIDYMVQKSVENEMENVHTENVKVPHWKRGKEYVKMYSPHYKMLPMLGLGYSVGTPPAGITAQAIVVKSFEELESLPNELIKGKIVVYDQKYITYSKTVKYRSKGASAASKKGAVAALVKSITPFSLSTPHTGMQWYEDNVIKIPVASLTVEDADQLARFQDKGRNITLKIKMSATLDSAISRNTILEIKGSDKKNEIVLISGHLDSWDVGEGAMDDGGGAFISWIAPIALKKLNLRPKRTIRAVLWTAEELGLIGSAAYAVQHLNETEKWQFVMESDGGTFNPRGITYGGSDKGKCMMLEILKLFSSINATEFAFNEDIGPDIARWVQQGIPGGELLNANEKYFWFHHSAGDRLNVLDSDILDKCAAFWAGFSYVIADMKYLVPRK